MHAAWAATSVSLKGFLVPQDRRRKLSGRVIILIVFGIALAAWLALTMYNASQIS